MQAEFVAFALSFRFERMVVLVIVGKSDPMYEIELGSNGKDDLAYLNQFILHSSLDMVDNAMWTNNSTYVILPHIESFMTIN